MADSARACELLEELARHVTWANGLEEGLERELERVGVDPAQVAREAEIALGVVRRAPGAQFVWPVDLTGFARMAELVDAITALWPAYLETAVSTEQRNKFNNQKGKLKNHLIKMMGHVGSPNAFRASLHRVEYILENMRQRVAQHK